MPGAAAAALAASFLTVSGTATPPVIQAHQVWADGATVPDWVRNACCGPSDVHHLTPPQVRRVPGGYAVDGVRGLVPWAKTLPSEDGDYWIFFRDFDDGTQYVFCFFAPPDGS